MLDTKFKLITEDEEYIYFNNEKVKKEDLNEKLIQKYIDKYSQKTDWKAASHSLRIALEVEELLETGFIKFPLKDADKIREIKMGNAVFEDVIEEVQDVLAHVDELLLNSDLPEESNRNKMNEIILELLG